MLNKEAATILLEADGHLGISAVLLEQVANVSALPRQERQQLRQLALQARTTRRSAVALMRDYALGAGVRPQKPVERLS
ncbi:hypothetical protein OWM54_43020 [Myxococcus sp. MISCRS1]|uniref:hypothetical protein n=1 Tax=Myxococcus sp. MISCRS1 TaxID=2996786 RepID=UPI00226F5ED3|nr:hypothetical protein [Myxococcus sp. MISCRS1]MCY1003938.1 hypothetical protein [Myxococcus sp. MISCRS1]